MYAGPAGVEGRRYYQPSIEERPISLMEDGSGGWKWGKRPAGSSCGGYSGGRPGGGPYRSGHERGPHRTSRQYPRLEVPAALAEVHAMEEQRDLRPGKRKRVRKHGSCCAPVLSGISTSRGAVAPKRPVIGQIL
eukprot:scaffold356949_cov48-Prasinocladus_malaysianus.AAC.1